MKIIFDTNFLINVLKYKIDVKSELTRIIDSNYSVRILDKTVNELKKIKEPEAKIALQLIKEKRVRVMKTSSSDDVDTILAKLSEKYTIATQDKELKKRLKGKLIIIRQQKYLQVI